MKYTRVEILPTYEGYVEVFDIPAKSIVRPPVLTVTTLTSKHKLLRFQATSN